MHLQLRLVHLFIGNCCNEHLIRPILLTLPSYGVVLKKARKVTNGKDDANVSLGAFMDTLVVLPGDLVQVIAKDFSLPTKDVCRTPDCGVVAASGSVKPQTSHVKDPKSSRTQNASPLKQAEKFSRWGQEGDISIGKNAPTNCNATNCGSPTGHVVTHLSWNGISSSATVGSKDGNVINSVLTNPRWLQMSKHLNQPIIQLLKLSCQAKLLLRNPNSIHVLRTFLHLLRVLDQYLQLHPLLTQTTSQTLSLKFELVYLYLKLTLCQAVHLYPAWVFIIITWLLQTMAFHLDMFNQLWGIMWPG